MNWLQIDENFAKFFQVFLRLFYSNLLDFDHYSAFVCLENFLHIPGLTICAK